MIFISKSNLRISKMQYNRWMSRWGNKDVRGNKEKIAGRRLKHPCDNCEKPILKGQKYKIDRGMYGIGDYYTHKIHIECD